MMADMVNGMEADDLLIHLFGYENTRSRLTVLSMKSGMESWRKAMISNLCSENLTKDEMVYVYISV